MVEFYGIKEDCMVEFLHNGTKDVQEVFNINIYNSSGVEINYPNLGVLFIAKLNPSKDFMYLENICPYLRKKKYVGPRIAIMDSKMNNFTLEIKRGNQWIISGGTKKIVEFYDLEEEVTIEFYSCGSCEYPLLFMVKIFKQNYEEIVYLEFTHINPVELASDPKNENANVVPESLRHIIDKSLFNFDQNLLVICTNGEVIFWKSVTSSISNWNQPLSLPAQFVNIYLDDERENIHVVDIEGKIYDCALSKPKNTQFRKKRENERFLLQEWYEFCKDSNLKRGDRLVFKYSIVKVEFTVFVNPI